MVHAEPTGEQNRAKVEFGWNPTNQLGKGKLAGHPSAESRPRDATFWYEKRPHVSLYSTTS